MILVTQLTIDGTFSSLLNRAVKSAVAVTHDLDTCLSSSHGGRKMYLKFIILQYARLSASAQSRNR